jgi:hypothetical protein
MGCKQEQRCNAVMHLLPCGCRWGPACIVVRACSGTLARERLRLMQGVSGPWGSGHVLDRLIEAQLWIHPWSWETNWTIRCDGSTMPVGSWGLLGMWNRCRVGTPHVEGR